MQDAPDGASGTVAKMILALAAVAALVVCAPGCSGRLTKTWPAHERPLVELPPAPTLAAPNIDRAWWRAFGDPLLDQLVADALVHNLDLAMAATNVAEARALTGSLRSLQLPRVDGLAKARTSQRQLALGSEDINRVTTTSAAGIGINWEIDLWGRIRQMNTAGLARLEASAHTRNATTLSIASAVVETYFALLALDVNLDITNDARRHLAAVAELERRRWRAEVGTELAYRQSMAELVATEARIPALQGAIANGELALAVLIGRSPRQLREPLRRTARLPVLPAIPGEFDSNLLLRRPDVASAEQLLIAANADLNVARAERLPRLNLAALTGLVASSSSAISGLPAYADIGAGLSVPLYDGGLARAQIDAAAARKESAIAHYRYTLTVAFREVYTAMTNRNASDREVFLAERAVALRQQSLVLAERSYNAGRSSKFEVLSHAIDVLDARTALTEARKNQFVACSQFYKALGGGF